MTLFRADAIKGLISKTDHGFPIVGLRPIMGSQSPGQGREPLAEEVA